MAAFDEFNPAMYEEDRTDSFQQAFNQFTAPPVALQSYSHEHNESQGGEILKTEEDDTFKFN
jgi:hypothetical protein